ncbi:protein of unknown function (plasmid) [Cupriavidus taiwanensis]|uniref:Uncharacterized protein n=1 Tax=Cupriavidus taiwanensis TaxID=164546 RepID=A0A375EDF7_9BURK|nr:protein of unknown function [Cupriavidus taiwanensis]SOZ74472.1 protein of unknown function [Cupriavidus taiwanensis]
MIFDTAASALPQLRGRKLRPVFDSATHRPDALLRCISAMVWASVTAGRCPDLVRIAHRFHSHCQNPG